MTVDEYPAAVPEPRPPVARLIEVRLAESGRGA
jgi:hypothetical protein